MLLVQRYVVLLSTRALCCCYVRCVLSTSREKENKKYVLQNIRNYCTPAAEAALHYAGSAALRALHLAPLRSASAAAYQ